MEELGKHLERGKKSQTLGRRRRRRAEPAAPNPASFVLVPTIGPPLLCPVRTHHFRFSPLVFTTDATILPPPPPAPAADFPAKSLARAHCARPPPHRVAPGRPRLHRASVVGAHTLDDVRAPFRVDLPVGSDAAGADPAAELAPSHCGGHGPGVAAQFGQKGPEGGRGPAHVSGVHGFAAPHDEIRGDHGLVHQGDAEEAEEAFP